VNKWYDSFRTCDFRAYDLIETRQNRTCDRAAFINGLTTLMKMVDVAREFESLNMVGLRKYRMCFPHLLDMTVFSSDLRYFEAEKVQTP